MNFNLNFKPGYRGQVTMVNDQGGLWIAPLACKDYAHDTMAAHFYPSRKGTGGMGQTRKPYLDRPIFVLWTSTKTVEKNALKFNRLINELEARMGFGSDEFTKANPVDTGRANGAAAFIAQADPWWIKSPVALSAYLTFLRLTIAMRLAEPLDAFLERLLAINTSYENYNIKRDAGYIRIATKNGNLAGLFDRSDRCYNREGYSDYLLSNHSRGLSGYQRKDDEKYPMDEESLLAGKLVNRLVGERNL